MQATENDRSQFDIVRSVLAADCACDPEDFTRYDIAFPEQRLMPGRRRFRVPQDVLIVTMGRGAVVSASANWLPRLREHLGDQDREALFSATTIEFLYQRWPGCTVYGPELKYLCSPDNLNDRAYDDLTVELLEGSSVLDLYAFPGFTNALQYDADHPQPDVLATVLKENGRVVGIAGASADSDELWQIGIDVVPEARGRGAGIALVARLTRAIIQHGKVPYYSTGPANIASQRLAAGVGFRPAWTELRVFANRV